METRDEPLYVKNDASGNEPPKGKKLFIFKGLALAIPFVFLVLLELFLRLCHYGNNTDLFIKYPPNDRYMVMNYYASDKFFPDTANATKGNQEIFAVTKSPNTFRIFVLGESTTLGFPFRPNGSFHRWLQYRLMHMYPDKNFEVINLSLTAVNSYTVLDFGKQLPQYQPDAVLIYAGHNEYYGALGVGSTTYLGSNRFLLQTLIKLRELKLVQLITGVIKKAAGLFSGSKTSDPKSLMELMAARQHIGYQSADYQAGIDQFDENMTQLCRVLNDKEIPVFLSTVVSNEKDRRPFISTGSGSGSADWYYNAGQLYLKNGSYDTAKWDFDKAIELDELRFRAPEAINTVIRKITVQFPFAHLVDTKALFEQYSPHHITGYETLMEHVHPNLFGYAIMSEAFYQAIRGQQLLKGTPERELSFGQLLQEMPITKMDSSMGLYQIMMLETGWPFNQPISNKFKVGNSLDESLAVKVALGHMDWTAAMGQLYRYDKKAGDNQGALKVAEAMVLQYPQSEDFYGFAGNLNTVLKNYDKAAFYYRKLFMLNGDQQLVRAVFQLYLKADDPGQALKFIPYNSSQQQEQTRIIVTQIISDELLLKSMPGNTQLIQRIGGNYKQLGISL